MADKMNMTLDESTTMLPGYGIFPMRKFPYIVFYEELPQDGVSNISNCYKM